VNTRRSKHLAWFAFLPAIACLQTAAAFTPVLSRIDPPGGQIGTEVEVTFLGDRLDATQGALFYQPGLTLDGISQKDGKRATARLHIAADAALGEHSLRLHNPGGVTEVRSFWVGQFPTVAEAEPNAPDTPQRIDLNRSVHGIADNEDEDCFVVTLKKGQRLSAEVEAMRLGRTFFDVSLAILDARGFELATCDDTPLLRTDAFVAILAPEDGDYRVVVREAAYEGNEQCRYRLHIGTFPRPTAVFPSGGKPGETIEFTFLGDPAGPVRQSITLPAESNPRFPVFPEHDGQRAPSPLWISVSPLESVRDGDTSHLLKSATALPAPPCAAHGTIEAERPADWFRFSAKKGRNLVLRAIARSHGSPLDAVLSIHSTDGKSLVANDDQGGMDSTLQWTSPADGEYLVQIRDHLRRSGPDFTYRIEITDRSPALAATLPTVERVQSQKWKVIPVPRGGRYAAVVNLSRENIACDAVFEADSLPPGIAMHAARAPRQVTSFPVVFEAAPDATPGASLHGYRLRSDGLEPPLTGRLTDTIHHIDINNQGPYHSATFDRIATAVIDATPFSIDLDPPAVPIVKNGTLKWKIRVTRQEGFAGKITARFLWHPPGTSGPNTVDIAPDQSEAFYEMHASGDAAAGDWQVCVLAEASTPKGPVLTSSALVPLKVAEPYVALTLDLAAAESGKPAVMRGTIETLRPFSGEAKVQLTGLPHGVTSPPQSFTADQPEILFPIEIAADARTGKHSGLFCVASIPENGGTIPHQTAMGATLRIDPPTKKPEPEVASSQTKPAPAKPAGPAAKPLSRLEQLRQQRAPRER
jgi:hypothetical protein